MHPATLLPRGGEDLFQRGPEPHGTIAGRQFRRTEPTVFQAEKHLAPALGTFPHAVLNGQEVLLSTGIDPNHNEYAEPVVGSAQAAVDPIRPDVDPFILTFGAAPISPVEMPLR